MMTTCWIAARAAASCSASAGRASGGPPSRALSRSGELQPCSTEIAAMPAANVRTAIGKALMAHARFGEGLTPPFVAKTNEVAHRRHRRRMTRAGQRDYPAALPMPDTQPLRRTSLYDCHARLGARLVPFAGWEMPVQYTGIVDEHQAVRTAAGLFDVSHMGELEMRGQYAGQVVDYLVTNDVGKLTDGQALYTCACNERGTILDDLIVYRCTSERYLIVCNAGNLDKMAKVF